MADIMPAISSLISSIGFPIVAFLLMWYALLKEKDAHKEEINILKEAIENNTKVLEQLSLAIGGAK